MTTVQVVETWIAVNHSLIQDYVHPDDHANLIYINRNQMAKIYWLEVAMA